jgi:hypothetical protein
MNKKWNYQAYCKVTKTVWSEELERLEEYMYSIKNEYDCSEDKYWVKNPNQDIPSYNEFCEVMKIYSDDLSNYTPDTDEWDTQVGVIKNIYYDNF